MKKYILVVASSVFLLAGAVRTTVDAQTSYARGQDVSPTFDGWEQNSDGTLTLHFGYFNRNSAEEFDVPIGPDNTFDPGGDRGQLTHFDPARRWWVFKVVVPADWPKDRRAVWTLTTHGKTSQAKGWLQPEWEVDKDLIAKNAARDPSLMTSGTNETDLDHENRPPAMTGSTTQTVNVSDPLDCVPGRGQGAIRSRHHESACLWKTRDAGNKGTLRRARRLPVASDCQRWSDLFHLRRRRHGQVK